MRMSCKNAIVLQLLRRSSEAVEVAQDEEMDGILNC